LIADILGGALGVMTKGPRPLDAALRFSAQINADDAAQAASTMTLLEHLRKSEASDPVVSQLRTALASWDAEADNVSWTENTLRNSAARRTLIYDKLDLDAQLRDLCETKFPFFPFDVPVVIAKQHTIWYDSTIWGIRNFYWSAYIQQLRSVHSWPEQSLLQLDESTRSIVERLANPLDEYAYQAKGLVVGYVQSGKTANFAGVIAKAADAGYRLVIVMAGTLDVLRSQTQRRLDKDLVGKELLGDDYKLDDDYADFLSHRNLPSLLGNFDWVRLTGPESDYQSLRRGIEALAFERAFPNKPLWDSDNCLRSRARIAVVKKNASILGRIIKDLEYLKKNGIGSPIEQVPVLVIDDESDQAGVNTKKRVTGIGPDDQERSPINKAIVKLLKMLPRAQYVGYTATPFANVFVDPASEADIFPKDFLISLPRPSGYMGVSDFYDLEGSDDDKDSRPNLRDFVRPVVGEDGAPANLVKAVDSFVLAGAIKLYRSEMNPETRYRHHTMLAHGSAFVVEHETLATLINKLFESAGYDGGPGLARLKALFESDFAQVSHRREPTLPFPGHFDQLKRFIAACLAKVKLQPGPVLTINNENRDDTPDFDKQEVWSILVGGTKLSRGYTVEGLTVSYYRRGAQSADTLMQMGRWFGFRRGYRDLVRLFIATHEPLNRKGTKFLNLYQAFGAICRDEEMFRDELKRYSKIEEPRITPIQVPPLVPSHMLRPTAPNKMYNAIITSRNFGGQLRESTQAPTTEAEKHVNHRALTDLAKTVGLKEVTLSGQNQVSRAVSLKAFVGVATFSEMLKFLKAYTWLHKHTPPTFQLQLDYLEGKYGDPCVSDWLFFAPQIEKPEGYITLVGAKLGVVYRSRENGEDENRLNTYNDPKHRLFAEYVTGINARLDQSDTTSRIRSDANKSLQALVAPKRGVIIYYPITEEEKSVREPITTGFTLLYPPNGIVAPITFSARNLNDPDAPVITRG
jgi:hypothetical protein